MVSSMRDGWIILAQDLLYRQGIVGALGRGDDARERTRRVCFVDPGRGLRRRQGFGSEFLACFEDQARRKPDSAAAASVANNAADRIKANPLDG